MIASTTTTTTPIFILPNGTFFVELVLFLIIIAIVSTLVLKPVQRVLNERAEKIRSSQDLASATLAEADRLEVERAQLLDDARLQARTLMEEAQHTVETLRAEALAAGRAEQERLLDAALAGISERREQVRAEVLGRLTPMVGEAATVVVGRRIDPAPHGDLIRAALESEEVGR